MGQAQQSYKSSPLMGHAVRACIKGLSIVAVFSLFLNLLMLTAPLYMLQVFDRVIGSRSTETLMFLTIIAISAIVAMAMLDAVRGRVMVHIGLWIEDRLAGPLLRNNVEVAARGDAPPSIQGVRDAGTVRAFLTGAAIFPIMDAPWTPIFLIVIFMLHPALGWMGVAGAVILLILAVINDRLSRKLLRDSAMASIRTQHQAELAARNADVVIAMGLLDSVVDRWRQGNAAAQAMLAEANGRSGALSAASKFTRMSLQILMLGLGAWLVLNNEMTPGGMIASSILLGRALAPVDQAINSWRAAVGARAAFDRISAELARVGTQPEKMPIPSPSGALDVERIVFARPGMPEPLFRSLEFRLNAGESVGVIGETASGKTTLARLIVGNLLPRAGVVRLDGANVAQLPTEDRFRHVGYLPQDIELFSGTVRDNIARLGEANPLLVVKAAQMAHVHEMILRLPNGYETEIGEGGMALSGGQRQRIGLARALYDDPKLVVLDEPNANLDEAGDTALIKTLETLRKARVTVVIIAHRKDILSKVDNMLILRVGAPATFGPRQTVLASLTQKSGVPA